MSIKRDFAKYVSLNIFGMIGMSCYFLADTYFISKAQGSNGITALNLVLPVYGLIYAIGSMIGIGSAIRFGITRHTRGKKASRYFSNALFFTFVAGIAFSVIGFVAPDRVMSLLGADSDIINTGREYTRIFMSFSPAFMWSITVNAFVRNDGSPAIATASTFISSIFNIVFDYILMFPLGMGMKGAALATALSPVLGILICMLHLFSGERLLVVKFYKPSIKQLVKACRVGFYAFIGELSSGIITMVFNFIILSIAGNTAIAAYGIIANVALVTTSVFNGIANGAQPLISSNYGLGDHKNVHTLRRLSFVLAFCLALVMYMIIYAFTDPLAAIFNSEGNPELAEYAHTGIRLYFTGIFFAGANIVGASCFSATENAGEAFVISILRGFALIVVFALLLSKIFGLNGVWLSYMAGEGATFVVMLAFFVMKRKHKSLK